MTPLQLALPDAPRYAGSEYLPWRDDERLTAQYRRVFSLMADAAWRTLREIADATNDPEASVSAQLRHARKDRFGRNTVEKDYRGEGLYYYRLLINPEAAAIMAACPKRIRTKVAA